MSMASPAPRHWMSLTAQRERRAALANAARRRPLLPDERREADSLDHRAYMRAWRQSNRAMLR